MVVSNRFKFGDELECINDGGNVWLTVGEQYVCKGTARFAGADCVYVKCDTGDMAHYNAEYFHLAPDANKEDSKSIADRLQGIVISAELARDAYRQERKAYLEVASMLVELQSECFEVCRELDVLVNGPLVESGAV